MNRDRVVEGFMFGIPAVCVGLLVVRFGGGFTGGEALAKAGIGAAVVLTVLGLVALLRPGSRVGGRQMVIHTHGGHGTKTAARHEGGHVAVARAAGAKVTGARIFPDGSGVTYLQMPRNASVVDEVAVDVAGAVAAGTTAGCSSDFAYMNAALRTLPANERAAAKRAGYAQARGVLGGFFSDGGASSTARELLRKGQV